MKWKLNVAFESFPTQEIKRGGGSFLFQIPIVILLGLQSAPAYLCYHLNFFAEDTLLTGAFRFLNGSWLLYLKNNRSLKQSHKLSLTFISVDHFKFRFKYLLCSWWFNFHYYVSHFIWYMKFTEYLFIKNRFTLYFRLPPRLVFSQLVTFRLDRKHILGSLQWGKLRTLLCVLNNNSCTAILSNLSNLK